MSKKTRQNQNSEEKLAYWKGRIDDKVMTVYKTLTPTIREVASMMKHIGVEDSVIKQSTDDIAATLRNLVNTAGRIDLKRFEYVMKHRENVAKKSKEKK